MGRLHRAQAERKTTGERVAPLLSDGFMRPKTDKRAAGKNRPAITEAMTARQKRREDGETSFTIQQNVIEQCGNLFLRQDRIPTSDEQMQPIPLLTVGMLTDAGDDGKEKGQASRMRLDLAAGVARFRCPDEQGMWRWGQMDPMLSLPECFQARLRDGERMAPTLREERRADGERFAVLALLTATALDSQGNQVGRPIF